MSKKLPARPNLEHLKTQAKDLLAAHERGEPAALARFAAELPNEKKRKSERESEKKSAALHDAQFVVAREYGFANWNALRAHVEHAENVSALMQPHVAAARLPADVLAALSSPPAAALPPALPSELPVIALRNAVLTAGIRAPLNIGRPSSVAAIDAARDATNVVAVFAQKNEATEDPTPDDLYPVGCAGEIALSSAHESAEHGRWIVVRTFEWIRLEALVQTSPHLRARVSRFEVTSAAPAEVGRLEAELRRKVQSLAQALPHAEQILRMTDKMGPRELADVAISHLGCSVADKARYASESDLVVRLAYLLSLFERAA
jgi:Lon protease-like protein